MGVSSKEQARSLLIMWIALTPRITRDDHACRCIIPSPVVLDQLARVGSVAAVAADVAEGGELGKQLALVLDPRAWRGVRHAVTSIVALAAAAVVAGARSPVAIGECAADAPLEVPGGAGTLGS
jgi:DDE_Tnp_1-associated